MRVEILMTRKVTVMGTPILMTLRKKGMSPLDLIRLEGILVGTNRASSWTRKQRILYRFRAY